MSSGGFVNLFSWRMLTRAGCVLSVLFFSVVCSLASATAVHGAEAAVIFSGKVYGIVDVWRMALATHEQVFIAEEDVLQGRSEIKKSYSHLLPTIKADGVYTRYSEEKTSGTGGFLLQPEDNTRVDLIITQPLYSGGRAMSALRQSKKNLEGAKVSAADLREQVAIMAARAYYNLLRATKAHEITVSSFKRAKEHLRVSRARFDVGSATKAEVLRGEADLAQKDAELARAGSAVVDAKDLLARLTGLEGDFTVLDPAPGFVNEMEIVAGSAGRDVGSYLSVALMKRRDLKQSAIAEDVAREGVKFAKGAFLPSLYLEGVYTMKEQTPETSFFLDESTYATLNISMPIFEGGLRRAELGQARSVLRQAELRRFGLRRELELSVRRAFNRFMTDRKVIEASEKQLSFAKENYNMVFKQYKYGVSDNTDLIDADTTLVSAEMGLMRAGYDFKLSALELKRATGVLLEEVERKISRAQ